MYNPSKNKQVAFSLEALSDALFAKMAIKPLGKITVTEVCSCAEVTRRTFYRNCDVLLDLVDWKCDRLICDQLSGTDFSRTDAFGLYADFFSYWAGHAEFLSVLFERGLFERFGIRFVERCVEEMDYMLLDEFLQGRDRKEDLRLYNNAFLTGGLCAMLRYWTEGGFAMPVESLADILLALAPGVWSGS